MTNRQPVRKISTDCKEDTEEKRPDESLPQTSVEKPTFPDKYANDWKLELLALFGFCISGVIFIISGLKNGNLLTVIGSAVWIFSCLVWMIPYRKYLSGQ